MEEAIIRPIINKTDDGQETVVYPLTHERAVLTSDGKRLDVKLKELEGNKTDLAQGVGDREDIAMSQAAVTAELNSISEIIGESKTVRTTHTQGQNRRTLMGLSLDAGESIKLELNCEGGSSNIAVYRYEGEPLDELYSARAESGITTHRFSVDVYCEDLQLYFSESSTVTSCIVKASKDGELGKQLANKADNPMADFNNLLIAGNNGEIKDSGINVGEIEKIMGKSETVDFSLLDGKYYTKTDTEEPTGIHTYSKYSEAIDLSKYQGQTIRIEMNPFESLTGSSRYCLFKKDGVIVRAISNDSMKSNGIYEYKDCDADELRVSFNGQVITKCTVNAITAGVSQAVDNLSSDIENLNELTNSAVWVDCNNGNDSNSGEESLPLRTLTAALKKSNNIILRGGIYDGETIDFDSDIKYKSLSIRGVPKERVVFNFGNVLVADGSEVLVEETTKVYKIDCPKNPFQDGHTSCRIYQDYIPDSSTVIDEADRLPQQKGLTHRCDSTIIQQKESVQAIEQLEDGYGCFWENGILYFSRPMQSSAENPIVAPIYDESFIKSTRFFKHITELYMSNVEVRYASVKIAKFFNARLSDVSVKYVYNNNGCFYIYDNVGTILERCEACCATNGMSNGDGFNVDTGDADSGVPQENIPNYKFAPHLTLTMRGCWSHDNNDDGYSDHDYSRVNVYDTLAEHCGKGGFTPAYGAQDSYHGCISRYNRGAGFLITGEPTVDIAGTVVYANGCVAYGNNNGFMSNSEKGHFKCINCSTFENSNSGFDAQKGLIVAVGCTSADSTVKEGNVVVKSNKLVE